MAVELEHPINPILHTLGEQIRRKHDEVHGNFVSAHARLDQMEMKLHAELQSVYDKLQTLIFNRDTELKELKSTLIENERNLKANALAPVLQEISAQLAVEIQEKEQLKFPIPMVLLNWDMSFLRQIDEWCTLDRAKSYSSRVNPKWSWGGGSNGSNQLTYPQDVALDERVGEIFIADKSNNRVQVCSLEGNFIRSVGDAILTNPIRISLSIDSLYVSQSEQRLIIRFNRETDDISQSTELTFSPSGIACYEHNVVYICEYNNPIIHILHSDLTFYNTIKLNTSFIVSNMQYDNTHTESIQVTSKEIWVLFSDSPYPLQCFTFEGEHLRNIISEEKIERAMYFCLDCAGNVLISDWDANRIKIFSSEGEFVATVGRDGQVGSGEIFHPQGIAVTSRFDIIIVDWKQNHPLQLF